MVNIPVARLYYYKCKECFFCERIIVVVPPSIMVQEITEKEARFVNRPIGNDFHISLA